MARRLALLIGNSSYQDPTLAKLAAPRGEDLPALFEVLRDPGIGQFDDVRKRHNASSEEIRLHIEDFFTDKKRRSTAVLFLGHGVRDDQGRLYLAVQNTLTKRLRATAISASFVREAMDASISKRQVILLDCCHSGAFADSSKAAAGESVGTGPAFEGSGHGCVTLTATDATQYAWLLNKIMQAGGHIIIAKEGATVIIGGAEMKRASGNEFRYA